MLVAPDRMADTTKVKRTRAPKKEKKPIQVVAVVTPDGIEGTFTPEPRRPLIVHLPFSSNEVEFGATGELRYDPHVPPQPVPYQDNQLLYFQVNTDDSTTATEIGVEQEGWKMEAALAQSVGSAAVTPKPTQQSTPQQAAQVAQVTQAAQVTSTGPMTNVQLLQAYSVKTGELFKPPTNTDIACFWCTCNFEGTPAFIPVKEEFGTYHVYGNYCSPQCALAFLLNEHLDTHVRWERMSLLHRMHRMPGRLYPSPPRESLTKYGGPFTIEQFRQMNTEKKTRVDIHYPPMVSVLGVLDTKPIDFYDSSMQNTFTGGFSIDRFKAWSEQGGALRLKRSKPLKDRESTLDACIQISVKRAGDTTVELG